MAILAAIAVPRFSGFHEIRLNNAASRIASDITYVQQLAITTQEVHGAKFDLKKKNRYFLYVNKPANKIEDPLMPGQDLIVDFGEDPYRGISLSRVDFNRKKELEFDALGIPYSSVSKDNLLTSDGLVIISSNGNSRTISVSPNTGKVSIVE